MTLQHVDRLVVRVDEHIVGLASKRAIALAPGREAPREIADRRDHVRLVERAEPRRHVAEMRRDTIGEPSEQIGRRRLDPAAHLRHPPRRREVVQRHGRVESVLEARRAHAPVVVELGLRELTVLGLDATPLHREPVRVEPEAREQLRGLAGSACSARRRRRSARRSPSPGLCSHSHQSLFQLPPSTWCAAVAVPQRKPSGKERVVIGGTVPVNMTRCRATAGRVRSTTSSTCSISRRSR